MSDRVHLWRLRFWGRVADKLGLGEVVFRLVDGVWYACAGDRIARGPQGADALKELCLRERDA